MITLDEEFRDDIRIFIVLEKIPGHLLVELLVKRQQLIRLALIQSLAVDHTYLMSSFIFLHCFEDISRDLDGSAHGLSGGSGFLGHIADESLYVIFTLFVLLITVAEFAILLASWFIIIIV